MQTVCEQKLFNVSGKPGNSDTKVDFGPHSAAELEMDPAEVKLSIQVFTAGLVISGLMLLAIHALGL